MLPEFHSIGIDLGGDSDHSAIADPYYGMRTVTYTLEVTHLEQIPESVEYTQVKDRIGRAVRHLRHQTPFGYTQPSIQIALGATSVPPKEILHNLRVLIEIGALNLSQNLRHRDRLIRECAGVKTIGTSAGHDDLVIALGLAAWRAKRQCSQLIPSKR